MWPPYTQCIQVAAAHSCYLVAELSIDSYSESARLCLIGADHLKFTRTFASPEAIQVGGTMCFTCNIIVYGVYILLKPHFSLNCSVKCVVDVVCFKQLLHGTLAGLCIVT